MKLSLKKKFAWLVLLILLASIFAAYYFNLPHYLSFSMLKANEQFLLSWTQQNYFLSVLIYLTSYILVVTLSIPVALFLTIAGGFLYGPIGVLYVLVGALVGSALIFLAVQITLGDWLRQRMHGWLAKMEKGFQEDAFNYLLFLRLLPIFPFWVVNIAAALLMVPFRVFLLATAIGIIPGVIVHVMVGNGLRTFLNENPDVHLIFRPAIFLPLLGLAVISLLPVIYKRFRKKNHA